MSTTEQYQPGDMANGHVLGNDGTWHPAQPPMPPPPPAPKKKPLWGRWYMVTAYVFVALMIIGGIAGGGEEPTVADQASASTEKEATNAEEPKVEGEKAEEPKVEEPKAEEPAPAPKPASEFDLAVDARTLIDAFDDNELAADAKYDGKTLKVTGVVDTIDTELFNDEKYVLNMTDGDEWAILTVSVYDMPSAELAKIKVGQTVSVIAEFDDGGDLGVTMKNGHLS